MMDRLVWTQETGSMAKPWEGETMGTAEEPGGWKEAREYLEGDVEEGPTRGMWEELVWMLAQDRLRGSFRCFQGGHHPGPHCS